MPRLGCVQSKKGQDKSRNKYTVPLVLYMCLPYRVAHRDTRWSRRLGVTDALAAALSDVTEAVRISPKSALARLYRGNTLGMIAHERGKIKVCGGGGWVASHGRPDRCDG